jgi:hypothetical protein
MSFGPIRKFADVRGPASVTNNAIVRWDGTSTEEIKDSSTFTYDGTSITLNTGTIAIDHTDDSIAIGVSAGNIATVSGTANITIGSSAGAALTSAEGVVAVGYEALAAETGADYAVALGYQAMSVGVGATGAIGIGFRALQNATAIGAIGIGYQAADSLTSGIQTTAVGYQALAAVTTTSNNTAFGYQAGWTITGEENTIIGASAGTSMTSGDGNILLGYNVDTSAVGADDELNIGGTLFGDLANARIRVGGSGAVTGDASIRCAATDAAFLPNVLTTAERNALTAIAGMICYNSSLGTLQGYDGTWVDIPTTTLAEAAITFDDATGHTHTGAGGNGTVIAEGSITFDDATGHTHTGAGGNGSVIIEGSITFDDATGHTHTGAAGNGTVIDHTDLTNIGVNTHAQIDTHIGIAITSAAIITDHTLVRGDGGARGVQDSGWSISDADVMLAGGTLDLAGNDIQNRGYDVISDTANGTENDYTPTGWADADVVRIDQTPNGGVTITGCAAVTEGSGTVLKYIVCLTDRVTLTHEDAGSVAANRFYLPDSSDVVLNENENVIIWYDPTVSRWKVLATAQSEVNYVTASVALTDNAIIRGDGGSKGSQTSGWTISDGDIMTAAGELDLSSENIDNAGAITHRTLQSDASAANSITFDFSVDKHLETTLTENITGIAITAPDGPTDLFLRVIQDGAGGAYTMGGWPASVIWVGGAAPTISTGNDDVDLIRLWWDGSTNYLGWYYQDFS